MHNVINVPMTSYLKSRTAYLSENFLAYYSPYIRKLMTYCYYENCREFCLSSSADTRLQKTWQIMQYVIIVPMMTQLKCCPAYLSKIFIAYYLTISAKVEEIFSFWKMKKSTNQDRATFDVIDFKRDALRHYCTNDVISEILPGISKLNLSAYYWQYLRKLVTYFYSEFDVNSINERPQRRDFQDFDKRYMTS